MTEEIIEIEKKEEVTQGDIVRFEQGDVVYIPRIDIVADSYRIDKAVVKVVEPQRGILIVEGDIMSVGGSMTKASYQVDPLTNLVFKEFERARKSLEKDLMKLVMRFSKALTNLDKLEGNDVSGCS